MPPRDLMTIDDLALEGKKVFLRVDFNVPVDKEGRISDPAKIKDAVPTVRELLDKGASLVIGTHQGRPGSYDFLSTEQHAHYLSEFLGMEVEHVDEVLSKRVQERVKSLRPGEVIMLENLRFAAEENIELPLSKLLKTNLVRRLSPLFDAYVNDAFQTAHRGHPSLVAFPYLMPSAAGRLMERMVREMAEIDSIPGRRTFLLGGSKVEDKLKVAIHSLKNHRAETILTGGLVGALLAYAAGNKIGITLDYMKDLDILVPAAKEVLGEFRERIYYPVDFIVVRNRNRRVVPVYGVPDDAEIVDIGPGTLEIYKEKLEESDLVVANGPMGVFEDPEFRRGTVELIKIAERSSGEFVFCGGHLSSAAKALGLERSSRVYTAGGAILYSLAGLPLPAIKALREGQRHAHH